MLLLAGEILSFSSPVADAAVALGAAVLLNPLRRRIPGMARHRSGPRTRIASGDAPAGISAGIRHPDGRHPLGRLGYRQRGSCPGVRPHPGRIAAERTLVTGARAARCGRPGVDQTPAWQWLDADAGPFGRGLGFVPDVARLAHGPPPAGELQQDAVRVLEVARSAAALTAWDWPWILCLVDNGGNA